MYQPSFGSFEIGNVSVDVDKVISVAESYNEHTTLKTRFQRMGTVFLTQSVRTRLTFEAAAHSLNIPVLNVTERREGEPLRDFGYLMSQVCDVCVCRLEDDGDFQEFTRDTDRLKDDCVFIDGGAGKSRHPTQAIIDVYTLYQAGIKQGSKIGLFGPHDNRAMKSFVELAGREYDLEQFVWDPLRYKALYCVTFGNSRSLSFGQELVDCNVKILHPFPRGLVIPSQYDFTASDLYHQQMRNAVRVRRAILASL